MNEKDIVTFVKNSSGRVMANHMEALNHCPNKRAHLKQILKSNDLLEKVDIPKDGETVDY